MYKYLFSGLVRVAVASRVARSRVWRTMIQLIVYGLLLFLTLLAIFDVIRLCTVDNDASKRRLRMWCGAYFFLNFILRKLFSKEYVSSKEYLILCFWMRAVPYYLFCFKLKVVTQCVMSVIFQWTSGKFQILMPLILHIRQFISVLQQDNECLSWSWDPSRWKFFQRNWYMFTCIDYYSDLVNTGLYRISAAAEDVLLISGANNHFVSKTFIK